MAIGSASLRTYGNDFDTVLALVTAGTEILTNRSSMVARGLQTINARIVKNKDILADYDVDVINPTTGGLNSLLDILNQLKPAWDKMNEADRVALGQTLSGVNQYKVLSSVMLNLEAANDAYATSLGAAGSAARENQKYMQGIEARVNALKSAFETFSTKTINSEFVKSIVNAGTSLLKFATTNVGQTIVKVSALTTAFGLLLKLTGGTGLVAGIRTIFSTIAAGAASGVTSLSELGTVFTGAFGTGGWIALGIVAVTGLITVFDKLIVTNDEARNSIQEQSDAISYATTISDNLKTQINDLIHQYEELSDIDFAKDTAGSMEKLTDINAVLTEQDRDRLNILLEELRVQQEIAKEAMKQKLEDYGDVEVETGGTITQHIGTKESGVFGGFNVITKESFSLTDPRIFNSLKNISDISVEAQADMNGYAKALVEADDMGIELDQDQQDWLASYNVLLEYSKELEGSTRGVANAEEDAAEATELFTQEMRDFQDESITEILTDAQKELENLIKEYDQAYESAYNSIMGQSSLYDSLLDKVKEYGDEHKITFDDILSNIEETTKAYQNYNSSLDTIREIVPELAESLSDGSVASMNMAQEIANLDPTQIEQLGTAFAEQKQAAEELATDIADQRVNIEQGIQGILDSVKTKMDEMGVALDISTEAGQAARNTVEGFLVNIDLSKFSAKGQQAGNAFINGLNSKSGLWINSPSRRTKKSALNANEGFLNGIDTNAVYDKGAKYGDSFVQGLNSKEGLDEHSPSKKMFFSATMAGKGWINGWKDIQKQIIKLMQSTGEDDVEEFLKVTKNALEDATDGYKTAASFMVDQIDNEISKLEQRKDAIESSYDAQIKSIEDANDALEQQMQLEDALSALEEARNKRILVFSGGQFRYVQDIDAIAEAQKNLDEIVREQEMQQQISALESARDAEIALIDDQIAGWEEYRNEWANLSNSYTEYQNQLIASQVLGISLENENWKIRLTNAQDFVSQYMKIMSALNQLDYFDTETGRASGIKNIVASVTGGYASGTTSATPGFHLLGEKGVELGLLSHGDGVIPHELTENLMRLGQFNPVDLVNMVKSKVTRDIGQIIQQFGDISLPNVTNANQFVDELKQFKRYAYQATSRR